MKARAVIRLNFSSKKQLEVVLKALEPETKVSLSRRSKVKIEGLDNRLTLSFEARDTSALRATINSYMRWISLINDTCSALESLHKKNEKHLIDKKL